MLTVVLGLAGALVYGAADFLGGLAARRISALRVTAIGAMSGVVLLAIGALIVPGVVVTVRIALSMAGGAGE